MLLSQKPKIHVFKHRLSLFPCNAQEFSCLQKIYGWNLDSWYKVLGKSVLINSQQELKSICFYSSLYTCMCKDTSLASVWLLQLQISSVILWKSVNSCWDIKTTKTAISIILLTKYCWWIVSQPCLVKQEWRILYQIRAFVFIVLSCSFKACFVPNLHLDIPVHIWLL